MSAIKESVDFRVGPGTPLGEALRRYWTPICRVVDVAEPDCDPLRAWVLGQPFVVFRDTAGKVGILDEHCPHRKVSLVYGRNEGGGIRCLWHQWKFATDGTVLETPNTDDCEFKSRFKANAYDALELGGLVWGYFGPPEHKPPPPWLPWFDLPSDHISIIPADLDSHFVRSLEATVDSSHAPLLHVDSMARMRAERTEERDQFVGDSAPDLDVMPTSFGFRYAAIRRIVDGRKSVRATTYVAPYTSLIPSPGFEGQSHMPVPQDDHHTRLYNVTYRTDRPLEASDREHYVRLLGLSDELMDLHGIRASMPESGPLRNKNHWVQDREAMRRGETYSGHMGLTAEDGAMLGSIEGIANYHGEHLVPADLAVVRLRRLMADIQRKVAKGETPPGAGATPGKEIASRLFVIEEGEDWRTHI